MSAENNLKNRIRKILIESLELNLKEDEIEEGIKLDELFGFDSLATIEFVIGLEREFEITIEPEYIDVDIINDLDRLSVYIEKLVGRKKQH